MERCADLSDLFRLCSWTPAPHSLRKEPAVSPGAHHIVRKMSGEFNDKTNDSQLSNLRERHEKRRRRLWVAPKRFIPSESAPCQNLNVKIAAQFAFTYQSHYHIKLVVVHVLQRQAVSTHLRSRNNFRIRPHNLQNDAPLNPTLPFSA